jgi:Zn ribbon nucleic-acid-binding protein
MMRYLPTCIMMLTLVAVATAQHPILPSNVDPSQVNSLQKAVEPLMKMTEQQMLDLIPTQSGLYFVGCINCTAGQQEGQLQEWSIQEPDVVRCSFCGHTYPSETYPTSGVVEVATPGGGIARYPYHEARPPWWKEDEPYRCFFEARVDYHKIRYMETAASNLARLYKITGENEYGRRAALILNRFAEVFPNYCYHFDYPFRQKEISDGDVNPADFRSGYRTARWTWWAYMDMSRPLLEAYDLMVGSDPLVILSTEKNTDVEVGIRDMLADMADQAMANRDDLTNMSPGMWADLIRTGRVLGEPEYVHTAVGRLRQLTTTQFFYDGAWIEGAPSYHSQVIGALQNLFAAARGYSDPPGYTYAQTGERFDTLDIEADMPEVVRAREALARMRMPDGRYCPVHDTWWTQKGAAISESKADLLGGLGHAILGTGSGDNQFQAHLTWSPGYGHRHWDGLNLLLWAHGHELLSDIGYTHTKWREWTIQSASHNLVVVDQANQLADRSTYGHLRYFAPGEGVQLISVDNAQAYPSVTNLYRRTVGMVSIDEENVYLIDVFQVEGGQTHDYFLHGSADVAQTLQANVPTSARPTLLPAGMEFMAGTSEQSSDMTDGHAYGYMTDLRSNRVDDNRIIMLDYQNTEDTVGLQVFTVAAADDELVIGQAPSIRQARSDDSLLDQYHRQFAMIRREGGQSLFASIIAPTADARPLEQVQLVEIAGAELALEVTVSDTRTDLILVNASGVQTEYAGRSLEADTELAILSIREGGQTSGTVAAGRLAWGNLSLDTGATIEHALLSVGRENGHGSLMVAGEFLPPAGTIITVDHGGQRTSAYTVASSTVEGENSWIELVDDPGFEFDLEASTSTFVFVPLESYEGAHTVRLVPVAEVVSEM